MECALTGRMIALEPSTTSKLKMLEPITLLIAISLFPERAALMLTEASGILVPKATIVRPMMMVGILKRFAIAELPSTKMSAPTMRSTKPATSHTYSIFTSKSLILFYIIYYT